MKAALLSILLFLSVSIASAQVEDIMRFTSHASSLYNRKSETDKWERQVFKVNHVILLNARKKIFKVVAVDDETVYNLLDFTDPVAIAEGRKKAVFTAVDPSGDRCKIEIVFFGQKSESIIISYDFFKVMYLLAK